MSLRFRRSIKLLPGLHLNLGLRGAGLSVGGRGLHFGVNRRGMYSSAGIPGTGLYAVHHFRAPREDHPRVVSGAGGCGPLVLLIVILILIGLVGKR